MLNALADPNSHVSQKFQLEHDRFVVRRLLESIAPATTNAFRMHVVNGASAKETAQALGVPVASVHTAKSRVLRRLRSQAAELIDELRLS